MAHLQPFDEKMKRLTKKLAEQCAESARLDQAICESLAMLGYDIKRASQR
jgi:hypothetical protein